MLVIFNRSLLVQLEHIQPGRYTADMNKRTKDRQPSPWDVLTVKEAADIKGVSTTAVYNAISTHRLPAEQHGKTYLIRRVDLEHYHPNVKIEQGRRAKRAEAPESQSEATATQAEALGPE